MSFQFVENGKIDGATRRLIRSHVMKGKNIGKTYQQRARRGEAKALVSSKRNAIDVTIPVFTSPVSVPRTPGHNFSFLALPVHEQPYMRDLIYQFISIGSHTVYPEELCLPVQVTQELWFRYLLSDEACFHSILVMSEATINSLQGREKLSPRALHHLSKTYQCVSQNLQQRGIPSDATIAAVMSMAIHEDLTGQPQKGKVHLDALERMVEIRGGIAQFEATRILLQKICRADIEYALQNGSRPRLNRDEFPRDLIQFILAPMAHPQHTYPFMWQLQVYEITLQQVFVDLMSVSRLLNYNPAFFRFEPFAYQEVLISVCYRLLHHQPLADNQLGNWGEGETPYQQLFYLGFLALMTTLLFRYKAFKRLSYPLLAERLRSTVEKASSNRLTNGPMLLWFLFVGGISVFIDADTRKWLSPHIKKCLSGLGIDGWPAARKQIRKFPWIDIVHDDLGHELWQAIISE